MTETVSEALWQGKHIVYRPGKLVIGLKRGTCHKSAYDFLIRNGCAIDFAAVSGEKIVVDVRPQDTLRLAGILAISNLFRYVEPDIFKE